MDVPDSPQQDNSTAYHVLQFRMEISLNADVPPEASNSQSTEQNRSLGQ